jgi:hypothetical protein
MVNKIQKKDINNLMSSNSHIKMEGGDFEDLNEKALEYMKTIIIVIILLIFLNLFITTYFYFTSLITANTNRSNCGAGGLTEAESLRHIFLQDNGNDKTRDIYIIIVAIFAIYILAEMFKIVDMSDLNIDDMKIDDSGDNTIFFKKLASYSPFIVFIGMLITIISLKMPLHSDITSKTEKDKFISTMSISMFFIVVCAIVFVILKVLKSENIYYQIFFIVIMLSLFILEIANIGTNIFKNLEDDNEVFRLINPKFNASVAFILLFSTFCLLCAIHTGVYSFKLNNFWYYLLLLLFMSCLFLFILMSSLDLNFKGDEALENKLKSIVDIFLTFKWFAFFIPLIIYSSNIWLNKEEFKKNDIEKSFIKSLVLYYALLFLVFLFYVYFMNKESTVGILSLQYFQLYNFTSEKYYEKEKLSKESDNYFKSLNISNFIFVLFIIFLIIIFSLIYKNRDKSTNTLILTIGMFIIASYTTGLVYLIYNTLFPIQQLSFDYKKQLIDINEKISSHIRTTTKEHTIDKEKIFNFNLFSKWSDVTAFKDNLYKKNGSKDKTKTEKLAIIKDEFRKIAPKGQNYDNYVDQSKDQKEYEEYILNIFNSNIYSNISKFNSDSNLDIYKKLIIDVPKDLKEITYSYSNYTCNYFTDSTKLEIPVSNNLEYIIKKNYKYVTGQDGELQKYSINLSNTSSNITIFYTIGYDYNNYNNLENGSNQVMLADKLYTLPAKYYACSYLNYHPKSDDSMNTMKFKNYIDEKEYDLYSSTPNNIVTKIEKSYNKIVEITKKELNPEKFYFLLIFLVILSIIILMYLFTLIKYYFLEDLYSPQMVVLGILAVFLTVFIFGEVIFSRIK